MSLKRVAVLMVCLGTMVASALAQRSELSGSPRNEISATFGKVFVSSQAVRGASFQDPNVHFGNGMSLGGNYSRVLRTHGIFSFSGEVAGVYNPDQDLNLSQNLIPEGYQSYFVTPGIKVNFFSGETVTPWVSVGGGYGFFKLSKNLVFSGPNPGKTSSSTGIFQIGTGLDVWPWHKWGIRLEARDFWSGVPDLNVTTVRTRQHNIYVGGGFIRRF